MPDFVTCVLMCAYECVQPYIYDRNVHVHMIVCMAMSGCKVCMRECLCTCACIYARVCVCVQKKRRNQPSRIEKEPEIKVTRAHFSNHSRPEGLIETESTLEI